MPRLFARSNHALGTLCLGLVISSTAHAELDPSLPPGGNFALENWSVTLAVDAQGGVTGKPLTLRPAQLSGPTGYSSPPSIYTSADGAMTFWAPLNGAASGGSSSPRSELREMIDPSSNAINWDSSGTALLDAQLKVMQVPSSDGTVIVGQVHGYNSAPLVLVYYRYNAISKTGRLIAKLQGTPIQGPPFWQHVIADDIKLGQAFTYQIRVERTESGPAVASVSANNGPAATMTMDPSWDTETFYFKAGSYLHSHGSSATEGALVKFYRLAASHPANGLTIVTNAALPVAKVGSPYAVTLQARGGTGAGTWRLVSGFPPKGLSLSADGVISGSPLPDAVSSKPNDLMVQVRDANGSTFAKKLSIIVRP
ncbi:MAG: polysaccharide lyase family 7 protein [Pseudomonadota bacterium]